jgi:hypothetical protein
LRFLGEETYKRRYYYSNGIEKISLELDWWIGASVDGYCAHTAHDVHEFT